MQMLLKESSWPICNLFIYILINFIIIQKLTKAYFKFNKGECIYLFIYLFIYILFLIS